MMKYSLLIAITLLTAVSSAFDIVPPKQRNDKLDLAVKELEHHLSLKAEEAPYRFVFACPEGEQAAGDFESRYLVKGKDVYFWGDDKGKLRGTLFAVELFAERELGIRFLWAGKDGTVVDKVKKLELRDGASGSWRLPFLRAEIRNYKEYKPCRPWEKVKNKMPRELYDAADPVSFEDCEIWRARRRLGSQAFLVYGHAFTEWHARFHETHPEYMNLHVDKQTGKTMRGWTNNNGKPSTIKLCVSNEAVVDQVVADWCAAGTNRYFNVCENDWAFWCECENCRALDVLKEGEEPLANVTDRYVNFWNRIAKKATAIRPDVQLVTYAYSDYRLPPRREKIEFPDNMIFGFVYGETENGMAIIKGWNDAGMKRFFFRPNYLHTIVTLHRGLEKYFYDQLGELRARGSIAYDFDANRDRPTTSMEYYVIARCLADPDVAFETIVDEYCSAYGAAAEDVRKYYEKVREAGERARDESERKLLSQNMDYKEKFRVNCMEVVGRAEDELQEKYEFIRNAYERHIVAGDLSAAEERRLKALVMQAMHGVLTYRFLSVMPDAPAVEREKRVKALNDFRIRNLAEMPDIYGNIYELPWAESIPWAVREQKMRKGE